MNDNFDNQNQYDSYEFSTPINHSPADETIYQQGGPSGDPGKPDHEKKGTGIGKKIALCVVLALIFGLVAGGTFLGVSAAGTRVLGLDRQEQSPKIESTGPQAKADSQEIKTQEVSSDPGGNLTVSQVAENCMPAMVAITRTSIQEVPNIFGYGYKNYESENSGSGIIIDQSDEEILIATNNHVVSGGTTLTVAFIGDQLVEGTIKGADVENDLAIVAVKISDIPENTLKAIKVIEIGDSNALQMGNQVVAIGNALGMGQSVSSGWVSAINREVTIDNVTLTLIQTDAAINPGNSGGALLNMKGELIGINESKYSDTTVEGMGYAIPVSTATPILSQLMSQQTRYKVDEDQASYLGVICRELSQELTSLYGIPVGVYVDSVEEGGPAAAAGIKKGDIIIKLDKTSLDSYKTLVSQLEYYAAGEIVDVTVSRADDGEYVEHTMSVTLGTKPDTSQEEESRMKQPEENGPGQQNGFDILE